MRNGGLVEAGSCVNIHRVSNIVVCLDRIATKRMDALVMSSRSKEEASVRSKSKPSKERGESFIVVDVGIAHSEAHRRIQAW